MAHPWHDIPLPADDALDVFPVVIEVPHGSKTKYELDKRTGLLRVDRVLYSAVHYPANYGFVPRTYAEDDDPIDVLVLGQDPVVPLAILQARAIGGFQMRDEHGVDVKIIAVHVNDPAVSDYRDVEELPKHVVTEMMRFFEDYKVLEGKAVEVGARLTVDGARHALRESAARYRAQVDRLKAEV
ncbi:MAG TPA: inorganic diphosphatase [Polyangia bacterium]|jgi:inorganic pyrophosphatase|nr:inorganic diphosphatase [Polyangia bacterium]